MYYLLLDGRVKDDMVGAVFYPGDGSHDADLYRAWIEGGNSPELYTGDLPPKELVPGDLIRRLREIGKAEAVIAILEQPENAVQKALFFGYKTIMSNDPDFMSFVNRLRSNNVLTEEEIGGILNG